MIYMFAVWEYEEDNTRVISFLKFIKDLMALMLDGRLLHKCEPLYGYVRTTISSRFFIKSLMF